MISVRDMDFSYGKKKILEDVNLDFEKNSVYCLLGANGSGKTTFVDCLLGINKIEKGSICIEEKDIKKLSEKEIARYISYIPQIHKTVFPFTVFEIVLMGLTAKSGNYGPSKNEYKKVYDILKSVGLYELKDRPCTKLSGGQMQLVLFARALVQDTDFILMDEPSSHLDFRNEIIFLQMVIRLIREKNKSCIIITHNPNHAFYLSDNINNVKVISFCDRKVKMHKSPSETIDKKFIKDIFSIDSNIIDIEDGNLKTKRIFPLNII